MQPTIVRCVPARQVSLEPGGLDSLADVIELSLGDVRSGDNYHLNLGVKKKARGNPRTVDSATVRAAIQS